MTDSVVSLGDYVHVSINRGSHVEINVRIIPAKSERSSNVNVQKVRGYEVINTRQFIQGISDEQPIGSPGGSGISDLNKVQVMKIGCRPRN